MSEGEGLRVHGARLWHTAAVPRPLALDWLAHWRDWFGPDRRHLPSAAPAPHLSWLHTPLGPVVAKLERPSALRRLGVREMRSLRAYRAARSLRDHDLPTPEPLAALVLREGALRVGVLVTRWLEATDPWAHLAANGGSLDALLTALAEALAELHGTGFRHRDLKAPNILVQASPAGAPRIAWTDLDGLSRPAALGDATRLRDLSRLCTSFETGPAREAGVRAHHWPEFLARYDLGARGLGLGALDLARAAQVNRRWARRHVERNLARGRPLT